MRRFGAARGHAGRAGASDRLRRPSRPAGTDDDPSGFVSPAGVNGPHRMAAPNDIPAADGAAEPPPERNAALLHAAVEAAGGAVLITSPNLDEPGPTIEYANPAFLRMTGYTMEEVIGRTPRFLQGPRTDRAELDRMRLELAAHG